MLGGIAAAGAGAAATIVAGCETSDNGSSGGDNGSSAGNDGPPSYGTGINEGFDGKIELDVRDSKADWTPFELKRAPEGAPNVLVVLYDDTGLAAWSPYGGRINMPALQRLADNGLTYTQWHTTALCSPTRSCFLTGRNHHVNRCASITEASNGFPGAAARLPAQCATIGQVLQDNGYSTFWLGKNHNVPEEDVSSGGSRSEWPLQKGFDRFYGFLGGETNQWYPDLVEDNRFIEQPYSPEDGYHLSKDLADQAIRTLRDQKATNPSKPWYLWFCPGANHAPHHVPREYADKYKGQFDDGYEAYREWVLARMIDKGMMPTGTQLTPLNPLPEGVATPGDAVRPWDSLNPDEKRLFARMAEVYAGFSEYTDAQVGRIVDYLEKTEQLDNTIIFYCADNGASGEGSPNGSVNENKFFNSYPDELSENMQYLDTLGSPDTYNHYPTGWAVAFSTPFQMFKRYAQFAGGTCDPLVIHWLTTSPSSTRTPGHSPAGQSWALRSTSARKPTSTSTRKHKEPCRETEPGGELPVGESPCRQTANTATPARRRLGRQCRARSSSAAFVSQDNECYCDRVHQGIVFTESRRLARRRLHVHETALAAMSYT